MMRKFPLVQRALSALSVLALVAVVFATTASGRPGADGEAIEDLATSCEVREPDASLDTSLDERDHFAYTSWRSSPGAQDAFFSIDAALQRHESSTLGLAIDDFEQQLLLVVDPAASSDVIADAVRDVESAVGPMRLKVVAGCNSRSELDGVMTSLGSLSTERGVALSFGIDPGRGRVTVMVSDEAKEALAAELDSFGELVDVVEGLQTYHGGRTQDQNNHHFGDARIENTSSGNGELCTSNVPMNSVFGVRVSMTAAHCGQNGDDFDSGSHFYGTALSRNFSSGDYMMLFDWGQSYSRSFYVGGLTGLTTRAVTGKINPVFGTMLCADGSFSFNDCNAEVYNAAATHCTGFGCYAIQWTRRIATQPFICQPGDSGGIMYQSVSGSSANAAGMIQGGIGNPPVPVYGHYVCYHQTISSIEAASGYTLALGGA